MLALIDYRAGNLTSVRKALRAVGADVITPSEASQLRDVDGIVVPGVGHFGATAALDAQWRAAMLERVAAGRPLLGICLGMQWLYEASDEAPDLRGLGLLAGRCTRLASPSVKVPHVGWNTLARASRGSRLLEGVPDEGYVYFTHSYVAPVTTACVAATMHGEEFASAVERGRVFGVQFHPEKSGDIGLQILRNFMSVVRECSAPAQAVERAPGAWFGSD